METVLTARRAAELITHRAGDYLPVLPDLRIRLLRRTEYDDELARQADVAEELALGWVDSIAGVHAPVFGSYADHVLVACPEKAVENLADEPASIHHLYIDGAVLRELLLFFADDGPTWCGRVQVRGVMARHFPLQLVAAESIDGVASFSPDSGVRSSAPSSAATPRTPGRAA